MIIVRPYMIGDVRNMDMGEYEEKFVNKFGFNELESRFYPQWSYTLIKDKVLIASGGIYIYWEGVAEVWLFLSKYFISNRFTTIKVIKQKLDELVKEYKIHRLQSAISAELPTNQRFIEWLGFEREGYQKKFGPWKDDYIMYAKLME